MKSLSQQLNLRPQEMRLVVFVVAVVFIVINMWLVWPHFRDWQRLKSDLEKTKRNVALYHEEINRLPQYRDRLTALEGQGGNILKEEQANELQATIYAQASQKRVKVGGVTPRAKSTTKTNAFFDEQTVSVTLNPTGPQELVDYLVALGADDSMIRVQEMTLRPDPTQTRLMGSLVLVASYQRNPVVESKPAGPKAPAPSTNKPVLRKKP